VRKPFFFYVHKNWHDHDHGSPDPIPGLMASAGDSSLQASGFSDKGMAFLPVSSLSHHLAGIRGRKAYTGRRDNCQGTHLTWKQILPLALLRIRCSPTKQTGFSPYEILFGRPFPLVKSMKGDLKTNRKSNLAATDTQFGRSAP
jgi:hypothetical protein